MTDETNDTPHIHVAILTRGQVRFELAAYLTYLVSHERRTEFSVAFYPSTFEGRPEDSNRNRICKVRPPGSAVLMLDDDMVPPAQLFDIALMGLDVVLCPYPIWRPDDDPPIQISLKPLDAGQTVFEIGADLVAEILEGGSGAMFLSPDVIDHPDMKGAFRFVRDEWGISTGTEDHTYCQAARRAGFKIHAALRYPCGHVQCVNLKTVYEKMNLRVGE